MDGNVTTTITPETLRQAFPVWRIARGPGHWFAVRGGRVAESGPESLRRCYLSAPDLPQLAEKLGLQQYLDDLSPQRLAEVWESIMLPEDAS
jgi:hypothetical protein